MLIRALSIQKGLRIGLAAPTGKAARRLKETIEKVDLKLNPEFMVQDVPSTIPGDWVDERGCLYTLPHIHGVDGMFAAKLKRS